MTDRECLLAIYKAVEALYVKLTGEPLSVAVDTDNGLVRIQSLGGTNEACACAGIADQAV